MEVMVPRFHFWADSNISATRLTYWPVPRKGINVFQIWKLKFSRSHTTFKCKKMGDFNKILSPLNHGGGGAVRPSLPFFLPFTQNYLEAPIPENSWPCKPFCCGCPSRNLVLSPSQKFGSDNRPCFRGLEKTLTPVTERVSEGLSEVKKNSEY